MGGSPSGRPAREGGGTRERVGRGSGRTGEGAVAASGTERRVRAEGGGGGRGYFRRGKATHRRRAALRRNGGLKLADGGPRVGGGEVPHARPRCAPANSVGGPRAPRPATTPFRVVFCPVAAGAKQEWSTAVAGGVGRRLLLASRYNRIQPAPWESTLCTYLGGRRLP